MIISVSNPVTATIIFSTILAVTILATARWRKESGVLDIAATQELKGLAILLVVFSHIGYFLVSDTRFLFPLSIAAGAGVNLFLFLSGFGLTMSSQKNRLNPWQSYQKRLGKIFIPMWVTAAVFVALDYFLLHHAYSWSYLLNTALGYFPHADLYGDLNSPLWYFSLILFYYLVFPWFFSQKRPWISAAAVYLFSYLIVKVFFPNFLPPLATLHLIAFPLGMFAAYLLSRPAIARLFGAIAKKSALRCVLVLGALALALYTAKNSNVGLGNLEEWTSIATITGFLLVFIFKKIRFTALYWFGLFSYEIYLLHWPIMYRFDFLFRFLPAWLATALYLPILIALGWALQQINRLFLRKQC